MQVWRFGVPWTLLLIANLAGCTMANPAAKCAKGSCSDPSYPYCDVDGSIGGVPGTCIAVTCTAGTFAACSADGTALMCNASGTGYTEVECAHGCDGALGCRACQPEQTVCANGTVQTCDANGAITSMEMCALGCFQNEPRCRDIDPSNNLGMYLDMVADPPDLDLSDAVFDTVTGTVTDAGTTIAVPSFAVPAPTGGVPVRVFVAGTVVLDKATARSAAQDNSTGPALAILAKGDITINGSLKVESTAGGIVLPGCVGGQGYVTDRGGGQVTASGGGGGAFATAGAMGGAVTMYEVAGAGGMASGTANLQPLRGGCAGGGDNDDRGPVLIYGSYYGGPGGGAVQLSSRTTIVVNGTIDVRGSDGYNDYYEQSGGYVVTGGGAGGGILIEAPQVTLGPTAGLLATGGNGGAACTTPTNTCGLGGVGATSGTDATAGATVVNGGAASNGGGGGGGLGRIRINTPDQTYSKSNTTVEDGSLTVGTLATR